MISVYILHLKDKFNLKLLFKHNFEHLVIAYNAGSVKGSVHQKIKLCSIHQTTEIAEDLF